MEIAAQTLVAQLAQALPAPVQAPPPALPAVAPDGLAAARFRALMEAPVAEPAVPPAATPATQEAVASVAGTDTSLGDRVLAGMQKVSGEFQGVWQSVSNTLKSDAPLSARDMLALQLQLSQVAVQYELLGKAVGKSTQNIDQLVRLQ